MQERTQPRSGLQNEVKQWRARKSAKFVQQTDGRSQVRARPLGMKPGLRPNGDSSKPFPRELIAMSACGQSETAPVASQVCWSSLAGSAPELSELCQ
jgi:hypothetical protein